MLKYIIVIIFFLIFSVSLGVEQTVLRINIDNIYADWFKDTHERCFIIMNNGTRFELTTFEEKEIHGTIGQIEELIEEHGYIWKDVMLVIHNHFFFPRFSEQDLKTYYYIKRRGFNGIFAVYITSSGRVLTIRSEKK